MLLQPLVLQISKNNVAKTIGCTTLQNKMLLKQLVFTTFPNIMLLEPLVIQHIKNNVARTIGVTTFPNTLLLKQLVSQHFQTQCC